MLLRSGQYQNRKKIKQPPLREKYFEAYLKVVMHFPLEVHTSKHQRELEVWKRVAINYGPKNPKDLLKKRRVRRHKMQTKTIAGEENTI
ncbi:hypothetical protein TNCV_4754021 [Trichonephila clavipes]|nr:hypothetical protein TNCV_4754021 [Trichonephila clavipes]